MEWHVTDAQSLAAIDREIGPHTFSPAEYEIVRRVIYATADFEYQSLIRFSDVALQAGAAALAARTPIVVDSGMVKAGILAEVQATFANMVYCGLDGLGTRISTEQSRSAFGLEQVAKQHPEAIFVIGQTQTALTTLVALIEAEEIRPALVIGTPAGFLNGDKAKQQLSESLIPNIRIEGRKGNPSVAAAIVTGLVDLAWQAYGSDANRMP